MTPGAPTMLPKCCLLLLPLPFQLLLSTKGGEDQARHPTGLSSQVKDPTLAENRAHTSW